MCVQYGAVFHRLEGRSIPSSNQAATSLAASGIAAALPDNSPNDSQLSLSRSIPYDSEQRYTRLQRDGLVSRRDKSMIHFQEDTQPPRRNMSSSGTESLGFGKKQNGVDFEEDSKLIHSESSEKALATKFAFGDYLQTSTEDEDVCPTCLDGNLMCLYQKKILSSLHEPFFVIYPYTRLLDNFSSNLYYDKFTLDTMEGSMDPWFKLS